MAKIDLYIPFILRWAAGVTPKPGESVEALFLRAKKSGWSDHPNDRGKATMCDVTLATYKTYCARKHRPVPTKQALKNITFTEWREILKSLYWDRWRADEIRSQSVAELLVDWVWGSGTHGIKHPQRILGVTPDGIVGAKTLAAVNAADPRRFFEAVKADKVKFYNAIVASDPSQRIWLKGWLNRLDAQRFRE